MGFDPIQHAMCDDTVKQEVKRQRLFGVDEHKISARVSDVTNDEFFYGPIGFSYISALTPTKEEIEKGEFYISFGDKKLKLRIGEVLFDNEMVYGGKIYWGNSVIETYLAVAYKLGEIDGFNIPKTGVYIHVAEDTWPDAYFVMEYETIHPIDPKFLPGVCLPVVELTTEPTVEGAALTEEESAVVKAAYATGLPAVVSFLTEGVRAGAVFVYGGDTGYVASIVGINFAISDDGNGGYVFTGGV